MKLVTVMPIWQRHDLVALILRQWDRQIRRLQGQVDLHLVCVGSEGPQSAALVADYPDTMTYLEHPNEPLNRKWDAGIAVARDLDPDALLIVGSDDLVSDSIWTAYTAKLAAGHTAFGIRDLYCFDAATQRLGHWAGYTDAKRTGEPAGVVRCHSRSVMEAVGWQLWDHDPARGTVLDGASRERLARHGVRLESFPLATLGAKAVDMKVGVSITAFHRLPFASVQQGAAAVAYLSDLCDAAALEQLRTRWRTAA